LEPLTLDDRCSSNLRAVRQIVQDLRSGAIEVVELPDPRPQANEVLVRNLWSLISPGTEQSVSSLAGKSLLGKARARPDDARRVVDKALRDGVGPTLAAVRARLDDVLTPGYSSMGVVEAVGEAVEGIRAGERVGCFGANVACHAERVVVPEPLCLVLPPELDDRWGAFGALGGIAAHALRVARVAAGESVAVIGLGLVGQLVVQLAGAAGARAIGVDVRQDRVEKALALGAVAGATLGSDEVEELVRSVTAGHGADAVIVAAATKDSSPVELAATLARDRATVTVVGDVGLELQRGPFFEKELELRVSRSYGPGRYDSAYESEGHDYPIGYVRWTERRLIGYFFDEVAAERVRLHELVTHEFPIERAEEAYGALSEEGRMAILVRYDHPAGGPAGRAAVALRAAPPARTPGGRPRVALIGPGQFARSTLLPMLSKLEVELVGIVGRTPATALSAGRRWRAQCALTDPGELLEDESVDVVVIATRHDSHADLAIQALQRDKGVFVEKPLAIEEDQLDRVRSPLADGGRLVVGFNRSRAPATAAVRRHFRGRTGPLLLNCRVSAGYLDPGHWLHDPKLGGGRLVGEGCHFVDLCSAIVEEPLRSVQVTPLGPSTAPAGDSFLLVLGYEGDSVANLTYASSGSAGMAKERIEVIGGGRSAVIDDFRRVELRGGGGLGRSRLRRRLPARRDKGHATLLGEAMRFFAEGGTAPIPYPRLFETTRATLVARDALARGRRDPVELGE